MPLSTRSDDDRGSMPGALVQDDAGLFPCVLPDLWLAFLTIAVGARTTCSRVCVWMRCAVEGEEQSDLSPPPSHVKVVWAHRTSHRPHNCMQPGILPGTTVHACTKTSWLPIAKRQERARMPLCHWRCSAVLSPLRPSQPAMCQPIENGTAREVGTRACIHVHIHPKQLEKVQTKNNPTGYFDSCYGRSSKLLLSKSSPAGTWVGTRDSGQEVVRRKIPPPTQAESAYGQGESIHNPSSLVPQCPFV